MNFQAERPFRTILLRLGALTVVAISVSLAQAPEQPATGPSVPGLASFDRLILELMQKWNIPGASVAVARNGWVEFSRGYGWADLEGREAVQPDALFRIASLSKPITATAALHLGEQLVASGKYASLEAFLDQPFYDLLPMSPLGGALDPRVRRVTIRDLLQHSGGWDRDMSGDPTYAPYTQRAAQAAGLSGPPGSETVIRYALGQPLDFDPGTRFAYSNLGYSILGRVIEKLSGQTYDAYTLEMLRTLGLNQTRPARTLKRAPGEVHYYDYPNAPLVDSIFPGQGKVPQPYGGFALEDRDAQGGWLSSAPELLRFLSALNGGRTDVKAPIGAGTLGLMLTRPSLPQYADAKTFYGLGWSVAPTDKGPIYWHTGVQAGVAALLVQYPSGRAVAVLINSRPKDAGFDGELANTVLQALLQAKE
jgi:CubicO group peptidase (beta-lactamase class C family)